MSYMSGFAPIADCIYRDLEGSDGVTPRRSVMYTRDWRTALRTPPTYRIGNRTFRFHYHIALLIISTVGLCTLFFYTKTGSSSSSDIAWLRNAEASSALIPNAAANGVQCRTSVAAPFNSTYPLTAPVVGSSGVITFRIAMVADLDTDSKILKPNGGTIWRSYLKKGYLSFTPSSTEIKIMWDEGDAIPLESGFSFNDRGMELSELVTFNGKLLTFDDRTGFIYELVDDGVIPWTILADGDGRTNKGFKSEWATVKQNTLYVGSMGKEWTTGAGEFQNKNPMYIKTISPTGEVQSIDWSYRFKVMRQESQQITWPGYMIHESGLWSQVHKKWFFLPRRCSKQKYNETRDEYMGCSVLISADEHFTNIETITLSHIGNKPTHGFSSFKFIPGSADRFIVALRSRELNGKTSSFISAFGCDGAILLPEQQIQTDYKYEGIEFI